MSEPIEALVARCGRPRLIIKNVNRPPLKGSPWRQVKAGSSEFLIVKARLVSPLERLAQVLSRLASQGGSVVEIAATRDLSAVTTTADVEPLSREHFRDLVRGLRVVSVGSHSVMGDEQNVSLRLVREVHGAPDPSFLFASSVEFSIPDTHDWATAAELGHFMLSFLDRR